LIAEDNPINQKLLLTYVSRMGMISQLAENGRIALDVFAPENFDVVLMDVAMPEMDGLEATRRIRDKWAGVAMPPILMLTAHLMDAIEDDAKQVGVYTVLSKPIPYEELKAALIVALAAGRGDVVQVQPAVAPAAAAPAVPETIVDMMAPAAAAELTEIFGLSELSAFVQKYLADATDRLDQIKTAIASGDHLVVTQQAHSLKGASQVFGFADIPAWAQAIEKSDTATDAQTLLELVQNIRQRLEMLQALL
jgi:CheY-like chemotaxis protein